MARGADTLSLENLPDREQNYLQVEPERPVVHIPDIKSELLLPAYAYRLIPFSWGDWWVDTWGTLLATSTSIPNH